MYFQQTDVEMAFLIDLERRSDSRGFFARMWCRQEFAAHGLCARLAQINLSGNLRKGTLRGMHFQRQPHGEVKVVSCTRGAIYDVVLDLRSDSPTYMRWAAVHLTAENHSMLYVPEGCAHGFQTLTDDSEVLYLMSEFHSPAHAMGVRFDDPSFDIKWPLRVESISETDLEWPDYQRHIAEVDEVEK
jgi:dTDP-4-dehydrorhamnose 3,5-epimerase